MRPFVHVTLSFSELHSLFAQKLSFCNLVQWLLAETTKTPFFPQFMMPCVESIWTMCIFPPFGNPTKKLNLQRLTPHPVALSPHVSEILRMVTYQQTRQAQAPHRHSGRKVQATKMISPSLRGWIAHSVRRHFNVPRIKPNIWKPCMGRKSFNVQFAENCLLAEIISRYVFNISFLYLVVTIWWCDSISVTGFPLKIVLTNVSFVVTFCSTNYLCTTIAKCSQKHEESQHNIIPRLSAYQRVRIMKSRERNKKRSPPSSIEWADGLLSSAMTRFFFFFFLHQVWVSSSHDQKWISWHRRHARRSLCTRRRYRNVIQLEF